MAINSAILIVSAVTGQHIALTLLSILSLGNEGKVAYDQSPELDVIRYTYNYKTRINPSNYNVYYSSQRIEDYWKMYNPSNMKVKLVIKEYIVNTGINNFNRAVAGIENYVTYKFYDIIDHWGKENIKWVHDKSYMNGTDTYVFSPNAYTSRAMGVTSLYNIAGKPSTSLSTFNQGRPWRRFPRF